ncbi:hypothetical protein FDE76_12335 [Clostridium botulinum]|uniref:Uncharacterized protein n=1 Tax=Clostridium botulinum (strain Eklund 17B / Type B) TaxID=935198 RepID=B2THD7_CLOBB|nr:MULTISPECIES: hypothetical protein [Clostridium]ACD21867.1 hypothetical protein CLL_A0035 [Clostridium botulinum B str. Eklund 17B (NRP)]MBY6977428.1 hypothetical protein [Clostridium botulinum]MBY7001983.1 hypothetical protein [Clostridium botulinum]MCR1275570.1 hypothetical protein [Clostridium botulinum]MCS6131418.1 hypothetical protein [Clostridium botulinum]
MLINLEDVKKQRDIKNGLDDEHIKIFRMISDLLVKIEDKNHREKIISNIYDSTKFFERRLYSKKEVQKGRECKIISIN